MDKMKFETPNITAENVAKIAELFPGVVTEGKVNIDLLRAMLGEDVFADEAYEFTWVGKRDAIAEAGRPIRKTLRPAPDESKDWDTTENLYIEGDNLDVLKLLQESYLGKVKMIYIDPPYNTGNDFVYRDNFAASRDDYEEEAGVYDEEGDLLFKNTEKNGRFHSDWCSMIYPRLVLARNLLRDDGVIFISIDDNEVAQLRKICDEVFGEDNFVDVICWKKKYGGGAKEKYLVSVHEYTLFYCKSKSDLPEILVDFAEEKSDRFYKFKDENYEVRGCYRTHPLEAVQSFDIRENLQFGVEAPDGTMVYPKRQWRWSKERFEEALAKNEVIFSKNKDDEWVLSSKQYINDEDGVRRKTKAQSLIDDVFTQEGTKEIKDIFGDAKTFPFPKPIRFIEKLLEISGVQENDIILDFFSGSAATAHAVMKLNAEGGGKRKFIMVQLPEVCAEGTEAAKAGYSTICEIGKERIRRAGDKIKTEAGLTAQDLDIGFRVLKLADTNMNDVYYAAGDYTQDMLSLMEGNIKPDRTDMDLLFGCLIDWGLPLSMPHTHEQIDGFTVHTYNDGDLIACFAEKISEKAIREIASRKPLRAVFRDSSFASSPEKINVFEIFKLLAPNTNVRVI
ncbi:MAG: site-specific DNA-methyltransferase [Negativicutes bacterium]|nr:site-specific DNA-methyltransferase [Negativicutes bacterium]